MSERDLTSGVAAAIQSGTVYPAVLFEGEFATGTLNLWSGLGSLSWNGKTWTGAGNLLSLSEIAEKTEIEAVGFSVGLSGLPVALISIALQSVRQGRPGTLWLACFDASGALIADPYILQRGKFDIAVIDRNGEQAAITINYESRLIDLFRARERRYTTEDQHIDYAADQGFEFVPFLQDMQLTWGGAGASGSAVNSSGAVVAQLVQAVRSVKFF